MPSTADRRVAGSVLLFALILMTTAGLIGFSFVSAMRGLQHAGERSMATDLAASAARMGARHAVEVMVRALASDPSQPAWAEGPQTMSFRHLSRDVAANTDVSANGASASIYNDNDDNVRGDAKLYYLHHAYYGHMDEGQSYASEGSDWPFSYSRNMSISANGNPRYVEPLFFNWDGNTKPVQFTQVPGSIPDVAAPSYYDSDWKPVASRSDARYRLRYAVMAMDLGGHPVWGRQLPFDATAAPTEWDKPAAQPYLRSFIAMLSSVKVPYFSGSYVLPQLETMFLGDGCSQPSSTGTLNPVEYFYGWDGGGGMQNIAATGALVSLPGAPGGNVAGGFTGGPPSWRHATLSSNAGSSGGWMTRWLLSPFGRATSYVPAPAGFAQARVDTPWRINPLTAPSQVIKMMLRGYMPQAAMKYPVTGEKRYAWDGMTTPAWPNQPAPQWKAIAYYSATYSPPQAGGPDSPCSDIQDKNFTPPSAGGSIAFNFTSPDYAAAVTATTYATGYPGPASDWEDYSAFEMGTKDARLKKDTCRGMLGADINVFNVSRGSASDASSSFSAWNETISTHGNPFAAAYFDSDPAVTAVNKLKTWCFFQRPKTTDPDVFMVSPFQANNYCGYTRKDADGVTRTYVAVPRDPMRGSGGYLLTNLSWSNTVSTVGGDQISYTIATGGFFHQDSYWLDLFTAMGNAIQTSKSQWVDSSCVPAAMSTQYTGTRRYVPGKPKYPIDVDRLFLWTLGEYMPGDWVDWNNNGTIDHANEIMRPGGSTRSRPGYMTTYLNGWDERAAAHEPRRIYDWLCSANIRRLRELWVDGGASKPGGEDRNGDGTADWDLDGDGTKILMYADANDDGTVTLAELDTANARIANMERVLNDMRMSFFGANPDYSPADEDTNGNGLLDTGEDQNGNNQLDMPFRPLDFDGDGYAVCSCYTSTAPIGGRTMPAKAAINGVGGAPDFYFSLTGYFVFEPARFLRILTRGEVWDELRHHPVSEANYEAAFCIDPDGQGVNGLKDSRTLYQRWITNFYEANQPATGE